MQDNVKNYSQLNLVIKKKNARSLFFLSSAIGLVICVIALVVVSLSEIRQGLLAIEKKIGTTVNTDGEIAGVSNSIHEEQSSFDIQATMRHLESIVDIVNGDIPTYALIDDPEKVRSEPFFTNAKSGDGLFVYPKTKIAILFRPSTKKIINFNFTKNGEDKNYKNTKTSGQDISANNVSTAEAKMEIGTVIQIIYSTKNEKSEAKVSDIREYVEKVEGYSLLSVTSQSTIGDKVWDDTIVGLGAEQPVIEKLSRDFELKVGLLPDGLKPQKGANVLIIISDGNR
jgi:hypothetical protein